MSKQSHDWKTVSLAQLVADPNDDIVDGPFGSRLKASEYVDSGVPIVRLQNIDRSRFVDKNIKFVTPQKAAEIARHHFVAGDILISKLGDPLGEACIAPDSITYGILVADVVRVRPKKSKVDTAFLTYALNSTPVVSQFEAETKGTTRPRVNLRKIRALQIPLVESLDEQRRIVAEIEKQFTRLEVGVVGLRRVQANLKRYRAAVLKAACEGKLVSLEAKLAIQSGRSFETGARLLERILTERRQKWKGKGKYKEPAVPNTTKLPRLPEGWTYASVEQLGIVGEQPVLTGPFGTNLGREDFIETGVPVLTIACLKENGIYLDKAVFVSEEKAQELQRYRLNPGDLLFSRMASVGRAGIVGEMLNRALFNYHIMRLRLEPTVLLPKYYMAYVRGSAQVDRYVRDVNHGATRDGINTEQLLNMQVALPPLAEQERIVAEVERRLSVVEELEAVVSANLQRATRLHQSILRKAFVGELVPNG